MLCICGFLLGLAVQDGRRHNDGYYQLSDWEPFDSQWVLEHKGDIAISLGFSA